MLGHGKSNDADQNFVDCLVYRITRPFLILAGKIHPWEVEADAFAVKMVGKEVAIKALKETIKTIPFNLLGNLEMKNRIKVIKKM